MKFMLDHWRDYRNKAAFSIHYVAGFIMFSLQFAMFLTGESLWTVFAGHSVWGHCNVGRHWEEPLMALKEYEFDYYFNRIGHVMVSSFLGGLMLIHIGKAYAYSDGDYRRGVQLTGLLLYFSFVVACVTGYAITAGTMSMNLVKVLSQFLNPGTTKHLFEEVFSGNGLAGVVSDLPESFDRTGSNFKIACVHINAGLFFVGMGVVHMCFLHAAGNSKFKTCEANKEATMFWCWAFIKDVFFILGFVFFCCLMGLWTSQGCGITWFEHNVIADEDGAQGKPLLAEIRPEWHLLSLFGALKACSSKLAGELLAGLALLLLFGWRNQKEPYNKRF